MLILLGAFIFWLFQTKQNNSSESNVEETANQILLGLKEQEIRSITKILEEINRSGSSQSQAITDNLQKLEQRFADLQTKLIVNQNNSLQETKEKLDLQAKAQQLEFTKLKQENHDTLQVIQKSVSESLSKSIQDLVDLNRKNFDLLNSTNQKRLSEIQESIEKRMDENLQRNLKSFEDVTKNLGQMQSTAQKMVNSTQSIEKLNNIFERTSSKAFGNFGEQYLEKLLTEHLSERVWASQVTIPGSSDKVDFVITMGEHRIGIDSKFPVTRYQDYLNAEAETKETKRKEYIRSVLEMAESMQKKYLRNDFLDALLIYLPSDSMYNELVNDEKAMEKLHKLKVTPTSPVTILSMITMIQNYEFRLQVNENAEKIIEGLSTVRKNVDSFREEFKKLGDKIRQAQNNYDTADRNLLTVQSTVARLEHKELAETEKIKVREEDSEVVI